MSRLSFSIRQLNPGQSKASVCMQDVVIAATPRENVDKSDAKLTAS